MNAVFTNPLPVVLVAALLAGLAGCGRKPAIPTSASNNPLGEIVGEETARLIPPGAKVLVLAPTAGDPAGLTVEPVLKSFAARLAQHGKSSVLATQRVRARLKDPSPTREELTATELDGIVGSAKGVAAVVSFVGFPVLNDAQIAALEGRKLKLIAIYTAGPQAGTHYKKLLTGKVLDVAVLPRLDPPASAVPSSTAARDIFNRQYKLVTPDTVAQTKF